MTGKFKYNKEIEVRWVDLDALNHVNNANYLTYIEQARLYYLHEVCQWDPRKSGTVLANIKIDFKQSIMLRDSPVVFVRCNRIGNKSFDLEYLIIEKDDHEKIYATGSTTMVTLDLATGKTERVPDVYRERLSAFDGIPG
ncbi:thioesterase family protein [Fulvivirgaceae bacterium BMA10]|uniref:Thioesterase family protein n=1 Tax=Splendidivirga corallicola TaxID=3051826 RepID=A0ABT8KGJ7_9BACT|nr:thioesterase family protein [Fulvivirgaceae bacterium BMA10]